VAAVLQSSHVPQLKVPRMMRGKSATAVKAQRDASNPRNEPELLDIQTR